ncbi:MAG TPA: DUF4440 domain-containing protein [Terracidiphilus sp.]|jgi:hypothetical protein
MPSSQEPDLTTPPELAPILRELIDREPIFHRAEFGTTRADFERMTREDFWETGASGCRYSRAFVLDELERRFSAESGNGPPVDIWETSDFCCRELAQQLYLLTYTLVQKQSNHQPRTTRRATIWQRTAQDWKIVYHQGTMME